MSALRSPSLISLVIPLYNEELVIPHLRSELNHFRQTFNFPIEIVLVNDGSRDDTQRLLAAWAHEDSAVHVIELARNFGHQNAITAGLDHSTGCATIILDADLQDPLNVISLFVEQYCKGYEVVYGVRTNRAGETWYKRFTAWFFYRLMRHLIHREMPEDSGDFRLISRKCMDALSSMRETHRFLRGMVAWVGFAQIGVKYQRNPRVAGKSKYSILGMVRLAMNAVISFSPLPLRISLLLGLLVAFFGMAYGLYALCQWFSGDTVRGWTPQVILMCLLGGSVLTSNGLLGEYIGRIFEGSKGRPIYIVANYVKSSSRPIHSS